MRSETTGHQFRVTTTMLIGACVVITVGLVAATALGWSSSTMLGAALQVLLVLAGLLWLAAGTVVGLL